MTTTARRSRFFEAGAAILSLVLIRHVWGTSATSPEVAITIVTVSLGLALTFMVSSGLRLGGAFSQRVLVVGTSAMAAKLIDEIDALGPDDYHIIGVVDDSADGRQTPGVMPRLGPLDQLGRIIDATRPTWIVMALVEGARAPEGPLLDARLRGIRIEEAANFLERLTGKLAIEVLTPSSLILSDGFRHVEAVHSDLSRAVTRVISVFFALAGLVLLAPIFGMIALMIKLDSLGPVFFVHPRIGRGGRKFGLIKFRTMHQSDAATSEWVRDNAHRITRVGKWLRRFRLDELPQLVNVLRGEMNIVGPRPHPVSNYELFLGSIPYYRCRSAVRPGITGWAQVQYGYANGLDEETEKMRYDLYYIKHRGIGLDIRILVETVAVLALDRRSHEAARRPVPLSGWNDRWRRTASGATF